MSVTPLGAGGEFDVIRSILKDAATPGARVALGAGDDCALIGGAAGYLAIGVDMMVEGAHFLRGWGSDESVGRRAVLAALSDLAAMAAEPLAVLAAIHVPAGGASALAERVGRGCRSAAEAVGATLIGGDISRGGAGLAIDVTVVGEVERPLLRSGVRPGDELFVTGRLGGAAAAVRAWKGGDGGEGGEGGEGGNVAEEGWERRFWEPRPRLGEATWLSGRAAVGAIDLSDGLVADAGHLAAASGVGIELDWERVPCDEGVDASLAMTGGEDYELLVAAPAGILSASEVSEFEKEFGIGLTRVGRAVSGSGVRVFRGGEDVSVSVGGFDHFRPEAGS